MKTIDLLVQALPSIGGWPEKVTHIGQDYDRELMFYGRGNVRTGIILDQLAVDHRECGGVGTKITREQYEAALAASKHCDHKWIPSEGRTQSGYLCSKCGNYDGPGYDWIDWPGGECPVPRGTLVDVRYRDSQAYPDRIGTPALVAGGHGATYHHWLHDGMRNDIIAYRLHQPQEAEQAKADDEADLNECIGQDAAPVWSGKGLPPIGCECQYRKHKKSEQSEWFNGVVKYTSEFTVVIQPVCYPGETVGHPANLEFRPIRSAEDEKRDDRASAIDGFISGFRGQETGSNKELAYALTDYLALLDKL